LLHEFMFEFEHVSVLAVDTGIDARSAELQHAHTSASEFAYAHDIDLARTQFESQRATNIPKFRKSEQLAVPSR